MLQLDLLKFRSLLPIIRHSTTCRNSTSCHSSRSDTGPLLPLLLGIVAALARGLEVVPVEDQRRVPSVALDMVYNLRL